MISPAIDYFAANLPYRPYHANELLYGLRIDKAAKAVLARYIQHNPPHAMYWLVFDVDRPVAAIDWNDLNAPTPNFTVKNPVNGHAHLFYGLKTAVRVAKDGSIKAIEFAAAVERGLRDKLKSDTGYAGLICKNPLHTYWQVVEWRGELYELAELADYVDLYAPTAANDEQAFDIDFSYGLGRNCWLFNLTRIWSYTAIRQGWPDFPQWKEAVIQRVEMYNVQLSVPLSHKECVCIGSSIAKWTHKRFTEAGFEQYVADTHTSEIQARRGRKNRSEVQAAKGRKGGIAKGNAYGDKREQARVLRVKGLSYQAIADAIQVSRRSVINWCK
ncbi:replication initiation protein [Escherichia coli]|nr:replication initiation protein [Escherichia coli]MBS8962439.1 replication initiation protein [Escherichia coli]MBS9102351.1 replication initiation protein [Escherichia coli]HAM4866076.1 plasmid replication protein [Escherichia coli]HBU8966048.1 replication initiation protein [Escherichia coli]